MNRFAQGACWLLSGLIALIPMTASAQTLEQARAAVVKAVDYVQPSKGSVVLVRSASDSSQWSVQIDGVAAGEPVAYSGSAQVLPNAAGSFDVKFTPRLWKSGRPIADMLSPSVTAVLAGLGKADKSVTEASFELDAPMVEQRRQAGPGGGVVRDMVLQQVSSTTMIEFPKMTLPDGAVVRESEVAGSLMRSAWLTGDEAGTLLSGALDHGQVDALLRDARIRAISRLGVSEATAALIFDLAAKKTPKETFAGEVLDLVTSRGETVTPEFLQALVDIDAADEANPLSFKGGDPGDIEIELEGEVCVEVSVPPFVKVSVCVKVKVKGKLRDIDALRRALAEALEQVRQELEQKIRKQLEDLKKLIEDLIRQFRKWMEQLDLPWWLRQIFMGLKAGTPIGEDIAQNAIVGGIAEN